RWPRDWSSDVCPSDLFVLSSPIATVLRRSAARCRLPRECCTPAKKFTFKDFHRSSRFFSYGVGETFRLRGRLTGCKRFAEDCCKIGRASCRERVYVYE